MGHLAVPVLGNLSDLHLRSKPDINRQAKLMIQNILHGDMCKFELGSMVAGQAWWLQVRWLAILSQCCMHFSTTQCCFRVDHMTGQCPCLFIVAPSLHSLTVRIFHVDVIQLLQGGSMPGPCIHSQ